MSRDPISRKYSRALLEVARERGELESVMSEVAALEEAWKTELPAFLLSPKVQLAQRLAVVEELFASTGALFRAFLGLVIRKGRTALLPQMMQDMREFADAEAGRVTGTLVTAAEVGEPLKAEIHSALSQMLGRQVQLEHKLDPQILGGFIARIEDHQLDASLRTRLEQMRHALLEN